MWTLCFGRKEEEEQQRQQDDDDDDRDEQSVEWFKFVSIFFEKSKTIWTVSLNVSVYHTSHTYSRSNPLNDVNYA